MKRSVTLSTFAFDAVAGERAGGAEYVPARLVRAIRTYLKDAGSDRPGWRYPGFLRDREAGEKVQLEIEVEEELWRSLEEEAARQRISTGRMVEHAALYFAAEVNAGRITERILGDLEDDQTGRERA